MSKIDQGYKLAYIFISFLMIIHTYFVIIFSETKIRLTSKFNSDKWQSQITGDLFNGILYLEEVNSSSPCPENFEEYINNKKWPGTYKGIHIEKKEYITPCNFVLNSHNEENKKLHKDYQICSTFSPLIGGQIILNEYQLKSPYNEKCKNMNNNCICEENFDTFDNFKELYPDYASNLTDSFRSINIINETNGVNLDSFFNKKLCMKKVKDFYALFENDYDNNYDYNKGVNNNIFDYSNSANNNNNLFGSNIRNLNNDGFHTIIKGDNNKNNIFYTRIKADPNEIIVPTYTKIRRDLNERIIPTETRISSRLNPDINTNKSLSPINDLNTNNNKDISPNFNKNINDSNLSKNKDQNDLNDYLNSFVAKYKNQNQNDSPNTNNNINNFTINDYTFPNNNSNSNNLSSPKDNIYPNNNDFNSKINPNPTGISQTEEIMHKKKCPNGVVCGERNQKICIKGETKCPKYTDLSIFKIMGGKEKLQNKLISSLDINYNGIVCSVFDQKNIHHNYNYFPYESHYFLSKFNKTKNLENNFINERCSFNDSNINKISSKEEKEDIIYLSSTPLKNFYSQKNDLKEIIKTLPNYGKYIEESKDQIFLTATTFFRFNEKENKPETKCPKNLLQIINDSLTFGRKINPINFKNRFILDFSFILGFCFICYKHFSLLNKRTEPLYKFYYVKHMIIWSLIFMITYLMIFIINKNLKYDNFLIFDLLETIYENKCFENEKYNNYLEKIGNRLAEFNKLNYEIYYYILGENMFVIVFALLLVSTKVPAKLFFDMKKISNNEIKMK